MQLLLVALSRLGETGRDASLEVGHHLGRGVAIEGGVGPCGGVGVVNGGVDVAQIDFAHEAIDLQRQSDKVKKTRSAERERTLSCREKLAKRD